MIVRDCSGVNILGLWNPSITLKHSMQHIVVPINRVVKTDGRLVMGAGLAKAVLEKCLSKQFDIALHLGTEIRMRQYPPFIYSIPDRRVIAVATKDHYNDSSTLDRIRDICNWMVDLFSEDSVDYQFYRDTTILMPKLGCGHGDLDWPDVKNIIKSTFAKKHLAPFEILLFRGHND